MEVPLSKSKGYNFQKTKNESSEKQEDRLAWGLCWSNTKRKILKCKGTNQLRMFSEHIGSVTLKEKLTFVNVIKAN